MFQMLITFLLLAVLGAPPEEIETPAAAFDRLTLSAGEVPVTMAACGWCATCLGGHDMSAAGEYVTHGCQGGTCGSHPKCSLNEDDGQDFQELVDYAALFDAAKNGDVDALRRMLAGNPGQLELNFERGAVQVTNCGVLHSSFPIAVDALKELQTQ